MPHNTITHYSTTALKGAINENIGKQRIDAFIRRGVRLGFYGARDPTAEQLADDADEKLFRAVRYSEHHVLHHLLPDITSLRYGLDDITLFSQQKLMIGILLLDNYSVTFIDTVYCFFFKSNSCILSSYVLIYCK